MDSVYAFLLYQTGGTTGDRVSVFKTLFNEKTTNFYERSRMRGFKVERSMLDALETGKLVVFSRTYVKTYFLHVLKLSDREGGDTVSVCIANRPLDGIEAKLTKLANDPQSTLDTLFKIEAIQKDLEECVEIMSGAIDKVLERGEKIDDLAQKTQQLVEESETFRKQSEKLNRCCVLL